MLMKKNMSKKGFVQNFIYVIIGLVVAVAVLPVLSNAIDAYTGAYASLVKIITLVVIAGLIFVALSFTMGGRK